MYQYHYLVLMYEIMVRGEVMVHVVGRGVVGLGGVVQHPMNQLICTTTHTHTHTHTIKYQYLTTCS